MKRLIVGAVTVLATAACGHSEEGETASPREVGATMTIMAESLPALLPVHGTVQGVQRASVSTRMMARVTSVDAEVGSRVRAGQVLVRLGVDDIAVNRARVDAAVRVARAAHAEAERHAARMDTLYHQDAVARVQRDQAHLQLTQTASQLAMAEASLAEVEAADRYAVIRAPFAGAVVQRSVNVGDLAAPGMPLLVIEGIGAREALLAVPNDLATRLHNGSVVRVTAADGWTHNAPVRAVAAGADPKTRTVEVRVALPTDWPTGVAVTALVPGAPKETIAIPADAVVRRGQLTGVRVVTASGPVLRWVRLGRVIPGVAVPESGPTRVEVLSGLVAGERIVL